MRLKFKYYIKFSKGDVYLFLKFGKNDRKLSSVQLEKRDNIQNFSAVILPSKYHAT